MEKVKKIKKMGFGEKVFPTFISSIPHYKHVLKTATKYTLYIAIGILLFLNIFLSQLISPLYFQLINGNKNAAVSFLTKIKSLSVFSSELKKYETVYGKTIGDDVFREEREQKLTIEKFEQILEKNPYSRDILYSFFFLTRDEKYLQQARMVDPTIGIYNSESRIQN